MSESKFTPGPWHYGEDNARRLEVSTEKKQIARINVAFMDGDAEANARLIAAAPDLLKACISALYAIRGREHDGFLRDAIEKATGDRP